MNNRLRSRITATPGGLQAEHIYRRYVRHLRSAKAKKRITKVAFWLANKSDALRKHCDRVAAEQGERLAKKGTGWPCKANAPRMRHRAMIRRKKREKRQARQPAA